MIKNLRYRNFRVFVELPQLVEVEISYFTELMVLFHFNILKSCYKSFLLDLTAILQG